MRVFGWAAGGLSALHNVPQIVHIFRRGSAEDLSWLALAVRMLSLGFYVAHGWIIDDPPLIVMSSIIAVQCLVLCAQKWWYKKKEKKTNSSHQVSSNGI